MDITPEMRTAIEAIVMVADTPVEPSLLAQLLEIPKSDVEATCDQLAAEYAAAGRGFILARVAGGYRFQTHPETAAYVERFVLEGQASRLSAAALETLAIVAYKQPISRMQIAAIRGVNVDGVIRTLQQRGYIDEVSRDPGPGNAVLFGTTPLFLERVGLDSTDELPPLAGFVPDADVVEALEEGLRPDIVDDPRDALGDEPSVGSSVGAVDPDEGASDAQGNERDEQPAAPVEAGDDDQADADGDPLPVDTEGLDGADVAAGEPDGHVVDAVALRHEPYSSDDAALRFVDPTAPRAARQSDDESADGASAFAQPDAPEGEAAPTGGDGGDETDADAPVIEIDDLGDLADVDDDELEHGSTSDVDDQLIDLTDDVDDAVIDLTDDVDDAVIDLTDPGVAVEVPAGAVSSAVDAVGDPPTTLSDVPRAKAEPIIEVTRRVAAEPPPAPFRATPGHHGAGDTTTDGTEMAPGVVPTAHDDRPGASPDPTEA